MVGFVTGLLIQGAIFGVALRVVLPGEQRWTIPQTLGIGIAFSLVIGFILRVLFSAVIGLLVPLLVLGGIYLFLASRNGGSRPRR